MKVTRLKLWMFRIELIDGRVYTVNRRDDVWCFGPEGKVTTHQAPTLYETLAAGLLYKPHAPQAIDQIVELLVRDGLGARIESRKAREAGDV
jgi:hypothetical protein